MITPPIKRQTLHSTRQQISQNALACHYVFLPQSQRQANLAENCAEILRTVNTLLDTERYTWEILSTEPDRTDVSRSVLILVGDPTELWHAGAEQKSFINFSIRHAARTCLVGGAILALLEAGAITSKSLAIPPSLTAELAELYPDLACSQTAVWHNPRVSTAVGPIAALHMIFDLIAAAEGNLISQAAAQILGLEDPVASELLIPQLREVDGDRLLTDAVNTMLDHIEDTITIQQIASLIGTSPRQLERRFLETTSRSPLRFYREIRLDHARELITRGNLVLTEIALASGFSDIGLLRKWYSKQFGEPPETTLHRCRHGLQLG